MKLLYMDCCAVQRPWDDRSQTRIADEAEAVEKIATFVRAGGIHLASSSVLEFEVDRRPPSDAKDEILQFLELANAMAWAEESIRDRARELVLKGIGMLDALHAASAEEIRASYFCTTDDRLLKRLKKLVPPLGVPCYNPIDLAVELGL